MSWEKGESVIMKIMSENTTEGSLMPFGAHKGELIEEVPDHYLRWLCYQDWFADKYFDLLEKVEEEIHWRNNTGEHVFDD